MNSRSAAVVALLLMAILTGGIGPAGAIGESPYFVCDLPPGLELSDRDGMKYRGSSTYWSEDCRFVTLIDNFSETGEFPERLEPRGSGLRVYDALTRQFRSVPSADGKIFSGDTRAPALSNDGRYLTFYSNGANLVPFGVNHAHYYQADLWTGTTQIVTLDEFGMQDDDAPLEYFQGFDVSTDGTYVTYHIRGDLLGVNPHGNYVYRRNMRTGELVHVSQDEINGTVLHGAIDPWMSDDGRFIAFTSQGTWNHQNAYLKDLETQQLILLAADINGPLGGKSTGLSLSDDGREARLSVTSFQGDTTDYVWTAELGYAVEAAGYVPPIEPGGPIERDGFYQGCGGGDLPYPNQARPLDDEVLRLYNAAFGRPPDADGQKYWIGIRAAGDSQLAVASEFSVSAEWKIRYGLSPSKEQIVDRLYANVLGRAPDPAGRGYWLDLIDNGEITVAQMLVQFSDSQENINRTETSQVQIREDGAICRLYLVVLEQLPDKAALEFWRSQLLAGKTLEDVAAELMNTDRYETVYGPDPSPTDITYLISCRLIGDAVDSRTQTDELLNKWLGRFEADRQTMAELFVSISQGVEVVAATGTTPPL